MPFPRLLPLLTLLLLVLLPGCGGSKYPQLQFRSIDNSAKLTQSFAIAAMSRDAKDDYDLVLVSHGLEQKQPSFWSRTASAANPFSWFRSEPSGQPLEPSAGVPIRQVLHMKIHWRPSRGAQAENPAASNATVRWLVFGTPEPTSTTQDIVEYQGTAFVRIFFEKDGYTLLIRKGTLKPSRISGQMLDPLGPNTFEGKLFVKDDPYTVSNTLADLPPPATLAPPSKPDLPRPPRPQTRPSPPRR